MVSDFASRLAARASTSTEPAKLTTISAIALSLAPIPSAWSIVDIFFAINRQNATIAAIITERTAIIPTAFHPPPVFATLLSMLIASTRTSSEPPTEAIASDIFVNPLLLLAATLRPIRATTNPARMLPARISLSGFSAMKYKAVMAPTSISTAVATLTSALALRFSEIALEIFFVAFCMDFPTLLIVSATVSIASPMPPKKSRNVFTVPIILNRNTNIAAPDISLIILSPFIWLSQFFTFSTNVPIPFFAF